MVPFLGGGLRGPGAGSQVNRRHGDPLVSSLASNGCPSLHETHARAWDARFEKVAPQFPTTSPKGSRCAAPYEAYALRTISAVHDSASGGLCTFFFLFKASAILSNESEGSFSSMVRILLRQPKSMLLQKTCASRTFHGFSFPPSIFSFG